MKNKFDHLANMVQNSLYTGSDNALNIKIYKIYKKKTMKDFFIRNKKKLEMELKAKTLAILKSKFLIIFTCNNILPKLAIIRNKPLNSPEN